PCNGGQTARPALPGAAGLPAPPEHGFPAGLPGIEDGDGSVRKRSSGSGGDLDSPSGDVCLWDADGELPPPAVSMGSVPSGCEQPGEDLRHHADRTPADGSVGHAVLRIRRPGRINPKTNPDPRVYSRRPNC